MVYQVQYTNEPYGWAASQGAYAAPQEPYRTSHQYEEQNWQQQANAAAYTNYSIPAAAPVVPEDPLAQVLQAERRRGREDRMPAPTVVEVKQADLTGSKLREDQLRTTGIAFGPSYQVRVCSLHLKGSAWGKVFGKNIPMYDFYSRMA